MRELEFIKVINETLTDNEFLGDDCAYLKDLQIVVTQDSLVEDIHFSTKYSTPFEIGYKSLIVNISDILASGAKPKYITISLSLPKITDNSFIKEFYTACNDIANEYEIKIVGGDITGSDKIYVSVCAIGSTKDRNISSRANAQVGDYIITTGEYGSSAAGLFILKNSINKFPNLINAHKIPKLQKELSYKLSKTTSKYTMMDTSDGLADAIYKIGKASNKTLSIDFDKIPYNSDVVSLAEEYKKDFVNWVLYGGEDYNLIACVNPDTLKKIPDNLYKIIGTVQENTNAYAEIKHNSKVIRIDNLENTFNHFQTNL